MRQIVQPGTIVVGSSAAGTRSGARRGNGVRVAACGAAICGAETELVISAVACARRSEILARSLCADLFAWSRLALSAVISWPRRAIDCCIALFSSIRAVSVGCLGKPTLASAPKVGPIAATRVSEVARMAYCLWRGPKGTHGHWVGIRRAVAESVLLTGSMVGATVGSTVSAAANDSTEGELTGDSPAGNNVGDSAVGNSVLAAVASG